MDIRGWIELLMAAVVVAGFFIQRNQDRDNVQKETDSKIAAIKEEAVKALAAAKEENAKALIAAKEEGDTKRARIYSRLDEVKKAYDDKIASLENRIEADFVRGKFCELIHATSSKENAEIKEQIKAIFKEIKEINEKLFDEKKQ